MPQTSDITIPRLGHQRVWYWRGWRIRYSFLLPEDRAAQGKTPLLLLHGFGANLNQWRDNLYPLSQHRPVYALDFLGFGASEKAAAPYGTGLWSAQVFEFWQTFIGRPVILMGHSLGALVALTSAIAYPNMVERVVMLTLPAARQELVSGWVDTLSRQVESIFSTPLLMRPLFWFVRRPKFLKKVLQSIYLDPARVDDELISHFALPPTERGSARTLCYLVRSRTAADFSPSTQDLVTALAVPALLIWGERDRVVSPAWAEKLSPLNPLLTYRAIADAGHCVFDEQPEAVNRLVLEWATGA
ncbi:alpha/beta fold hydrolase [Pseudanabaena sp. FACHB-2040]|uniref:alpha/beta fold hydrolase n=1 Tax=Pseudanabaena sp. FACHB-2040 TaxID=2692859 RepID=UPI001686BECC|nr:alpha/beta fold hydrolase [Pseudanabaena sp. FACHB-2040]MBD2256219.1 alpha/beta fold hydrolase [Pseudanabaena sp. FACHB-2040]